MRFLTSNPYLKAKEAVRQHPQSFLQENIGHAKCHNRTLFRRLSSHSSGYEAKVSCLSRGLVTWLMVLRLTAELGCRSYGFPLGALLHRQLKVVGFQPVRCRLMPVSDAHGKLVRAGFLRQVSKSLSVWACR
jgi:hypothetical protein